MHHYATQLNRVGKSKTYKDNVRRRNQNSLKLNVFISSQEKVLIPKKSWVKGKFCQQILGSKHCRFRLIALLMKKHLDQEENVHCHTRKYSFEKLQVLEGSSRKFSGKLVHFVKAWASFFCHFPVNCGRVRQISGEIHRIPDYGLLTVL